MQLQSRIGLRQQLRHFQRPMPLQTQHGRAAMRQTQAWPLLRYDGPLSLRSRTQHGARQVCQKTAGVGRESGDGWKVDRLMGE